MRSPYPGLTKGPYGSASSRNSADPRDLDGETWDHHPSLMSSTSPGRSAATFGVEIRKRNDETSRLRQENFALNMRIHQLLTKSTSSPRSPTDLPADNFYEFENDGQNTSPEPAPPLEDSNKIIATLRLEVDDLREENRELTASNDRLNGTLDDLREKALAEREEAQKKLKAQLIEMQTLANRSEDLKSEKTQLHVQIAHAKEEIENTRKQAFDAKATIEEGKHRERALLTRVEGYRMQYDAAVAAMGTEKKRAQEASEKLGLGNVEILELRKTLEEKAAEVDDLRRGISVVTRERDVAKEGLKREKERASIWQETEKLVEQGETLLDGGPALETMMRVLDTQKKKYSELHYDPRWRDMMVDDLNECLRMLYQSQREVEAKRQIFIEKYCARDFAPEGTATPLIS